MIYKYTTLHFFDQFKNTYLEVDSSFIGIRSILLQNLEERGNEKGWSVDVNPYAHKFPDSKYLKLVAFAKSLSATEFRHENN